MASLQISQGTFRLSDTRLLNLNDLKLEEGQSWAFVEASGSARTLADVPFHSLSMGPAAAGLDPPARC